MRTPEGGVRRSSPKCAIAFWDCEVSSTANRFGHRSGRSKRCGHRVSRPAYQKNKAVLSQVLIFLCLCPQGTTSFCNFSCKHHFEHSENIIVRKADTKRSCATRKQCYTLRCKRCDASRQRCYGFAVNTCVLRKSKYLPPDLLKICFRCDIIYKTLF